VPKLTLETKKERYYYYYYYHLTLILDVVTHSRARLFHTAMMFIIKTPLLHAVVIGDMPFFKELIALGADRYSMTNYGMVMRKSTATTTYVT